MTFRPQHDGSIVCGFILEWQNKKIRYTLFLLCLLKDRRSMLKCKNQVNFLSLLVFCLVSLGSRRTKLKDWVWKNQWRRNKCTIRELLVIRYTTTQHRVTVTLCSADVTLNLLLSNPDFYIFPIDEYVLHYSDAFQLERNNLYVTDCLEIPHWSLCSNYQLQLFSKCFLPELRMFLLSEGKYYKLLKAEL